MSSTICPVADFHTHTVFSDHAYSTITENAVAAARRGLLAVACTDHGPAIRDGGDPLHFKNLRILPPTIEGVRMLRGAEANVMDINGTLDMDSAVLQRLDVVIASMHGGYMQAGSREQITNAWLAVAENPDVDIIGHCGTPGFAFDYETVIPVFGQYGKVVEINEGTFRVRQSSLENCRRIASVCKQHGVFVVVNSDAHFHEQVGCFSGALQLLEDIDFPPELVVNSTKERLEAFLQSKQLSL